MIHYLKQEDILTIYHWMIAQSGGMYGIRDMGALESALAQPRMTFDEKELYPTIIDKAAVLGFSLTRSHIWATPFPHS